MKELYNHMDEESRDTAKNIRIAFDDSAWDKMEELLNEDDRKPVIRAISNKLKAGRNANKSRTSAVLFLIFLFTGSSVLFIKKDNTFKNKTISLFNTNKPSGIKNIQPDEGNITAPHFATAQHLSNNLSKKESEKFILISKNLKSKATVYNKKTLSEPTSSRFKKEKKTDNKQMNLIDRKDDLNIANNNWQGNGETNLSVLKQMESNKEEVKVPLTINKKDLVITEPTNKIKKTSISSKNRVFKNIGFTVFVSPEVNTVKFKRSDKITVNYGAGINYNIGKHFIVQAQFANTRKVYVTDREGYTPPSGSSLTPVATLKINADCKVWDIPVSLRYSFRGNIKNSFFISAGISSYIMKKETYNLSYYNQGVYETKQRIIENGNKHGFCNLNLSTGYQYWLNKKWSVGFEPYLKLPLYGIGAGKVNLTSAGAFFSLTFKPIKAAR